MDDVRDIVLSLPQLLPVFVEWAAEDAKPPGWDTFAQYSVLGLGVLGFGFVLYKVFMQLLARSAAELEREVARGDRLEAENKVLNTAMQDKAIPALLAMTTVLTKCTELLQEQQREREYAARRRDRDGEPH